MRVLVGDTMDIPLYVVADTVAGSHGSDIRAIIKALHSRGYDATRVELNRMLYGHPEAFTRSPATQGLRPKWFSLTSIPHPPPFPQNVPVGGSRTHSPGTQSAEDQITRGLLVAMNTLDMILARRKDWEMRS